MGRGRAKAKQTKVARQLKYSTHNTDLDSLQRELSGGEGLTHSPVDDTSDQDSWSTQDEWRHA
ncbi:MAG: DUF3073 domain-containing protein [Gordonia sp. (in: high G+C Gram-positive bacteria)]|uniref:DUF3073 domain-containing protein n=1 Tax=Gordonia sp. (in: high G+C Gram-positive bacteria) TaxID=84139 RepID=UPI003BB5B269